MTTLCVIAAGFNTIADGIQTVFEVDLVAAPVAFAQTVIVGVAGAPAIFNPGFDPIRPRPVDVVRGAIGSTAVLSGYKVITTYDAAPPAGPLTIQFNLHYSR